MGSRVKKITRYKERQYTKRIDYLRNLRHSILEYGSKNIVYFDESGFEETVFNPHVWSLRGQKIFGDKQGKRSKRTNLIMAQCRKKWLAPMLFEGSCNHRLVEEWLENHLFKELENPSVIILDNAPFHRKSRLHELAKNHGHKVLFLPPYSPDFNPIEQSFGLLKRWRLYRPDTSLDTLLMGN